MVKHIVSVSSGLGSAYTWKLACDAHGPENVTGRLRVLLPQRP